MTPYPGFGENSILGNDFKRTHNVNCTSILAKHQLNCKMIYLNLENKDLSKF